MQIRARARGEEGAAAVEFALIVGVLAMLLFGMLQFGLAFFQLQNLRAATREGARIGAVQGTVQNIRDRVQSDSGIDAPFGSSLYVKKVTGTTQTTVTDVTARPCAEVNNVRPDSVLAGIDLGSSSLPSGLKNMFTINIPLLPQIDLTSAEVEGQFRCES
jgi:Flp pilus assembly protein TadG